MNQSAPWPVYFQPQSGAASSSERDSLVPSHVLDMFTLRDPRSSQAERVVVVGCLGGGLLVVTEGNFGTLDAELRRQIQSAEVSLRDQFRTIVASDLTISTLDAIEQRVRARGLNDAIFLYGTLYARLIFVGGQLQVAPCATNGHFTAGRLDVLHGCRLGAKHAFHSPLVEGEQIRHVALPAAPLEAIQQGQGVAQLYPFLDPLKIQSADNTFILLRIVYDLLTHLQQDMRHEGTHHTFAQATIFVPSRRQLEQELANDGYQIDGDTAFRQRASSTSTNTSLLGRLRSIAHEWTAPRIALPPQATLEDYEQLIDRLLSSVASTADTAMMQAVNKCIAPPTPARHVLPVNSAGVKTTRLTPPAPKTPPIVPPPIASRDWSADFGSITSKPVDPDKAWWLEVQATQTETSKRDLVSKDDWLRDFLASAHVDSAGSESSQDEQPAKSTWSDDFSTKATKSSPKQSDWTNDFEPTE